jgi:glycosyltransferase involved in cell wall biosynthesis
MAACKRAKVPVALSPIWWDLFEFYGRSRGCERALAGAERRIAAGLARLRATPSERLLRRNERRKYAARLALQTSLMRRADVLLPNSTIEAHHYMHRLQLQDRPIVAVHHAIDFPARESSDAPRTGVVCAARIESKKNQAMLLYALRDLDVDVTLIGACYDPPYMELCRRFATERVRFTGSLSREETLRLMAGAAVHVLPSWAETPGLVSLEAAAMGARPVVSNNGTECEYFAEHALYVDPEDPTGIRAAVERALALPPRRLGDDLDRRVAAFDLVAVARRTLEGYRSISQS